MCINKQLLFGKINYITNAVGYILQREYFNKKRAM
jgi:hypothetical protein